jgi:CRP-like cAMP-binding protein
MDVLGEAFPNSRPETRRDLAGIAAMRRVTAGELIISQGETSSLALVVEGHIAVRRTTMDGREYMVRIVTRGQLSPVLPLAARSASADAIALTMSEIATWKADEMRSRAKMDPGLAVDILDDVLGSLDEVMGRIDGLLYQNALRRVARVLEEHLDLFFGSPPVLTRTQLPMLVGTSREMTGRVLRVLEARQLVARVGRNRLRLLDRAGLAAIADTDPERVRPSHEPEISLGSAALS